MESLELIASLYGRYFDEFESQFYKGLDKTNARRGFVKHYMTTRTDAYKFCEMVSYRQNYIYKKCI